MSNDHNSDIHWLNDPWAAAFCLLAGFNLDGIRIDSPDRVAWGFNNRMGVRKALNEEYQESLDVFSTKRVRSAYLTIMSMGKDVLEAAKIDSAGSGDGQSRQFRINEIKGDPRWNFNP